MTEQEVQNAVDVWQKQMMREGWIEYWLHPKAKDSLISQVIQLSNKTAVVAEVDVTLPEITTRAAAVTLPAQENSADTKPTGYVSKKKITKRTMKKRRSTRHHVFEIFAKCSRRPLRLKSIEINEASVGTAEMPESSKQRCAMGRDDDLKFEAFCGRHKDVS